jgi:hypothetical protein
VSRRPRWASPGSIHAALEVLPPILRHLDLLYRHLARVFPTDAEKDEEVLRSTIQNAIEVSSIVASQLTKLALDLRTVGKRQVGARM